jgi:hypothetical protein
VTWEIAPLRAAALRTERAVNQRWETVRAAIIGSAVLLGVIGSAAALSLTGMSSMPGGMGFLSAAAASSADHEVTASEARDGVADQGAPTPTSDPTPPAEDDEATTTEQPAGAAPAATQPEPERGTPSAEPQPAPEPGVLPSVLPTPEPTQTPPADEVASDEEDGGILDDLLDLLLPGLLG